MDKAKPIIMSADSVRAIFEGRKTMTRRVAKLSPLMMEDEAEDWCPYGKVGSRLWVREPFGILCPYPPKQVLKEQLRSFITYKPINPSYGFDISNYQWLSPIYMPKWLSRITLEITDVRVERLQEIPDSDILREGIEAIAETPEPRQYRHSLFVIQWNKFNKKRGFGWDTDPWVWVIEFKVNKDS